MKVVIDASVALKWVIPEPGSDAANALRSAELVAPSLWLPEAANALWRLVRLNQITADHASRRLSELANAPILSIALEPHVETALKLAIEIRHPIYDCLYLAVALHFDTRVVTADRRFAAAVAFTAYADNVELLGAAGYRSLHEP